MKPVTNPVGQQIMTKELCELLNKAFERVDKDELWFALDLEYSYSSEEVDGKEVFVKCVAIQPPSDAADIMLAVGALNDFGTPAGIAVELARFMADRFNDPVRELNRAADIKSNAGFTKIPPLLVFPNYQWNSEVKVPDTVVRKLTP